MRHRLTPTAMLMGLAVCGLLILSGGAARAQPVGPDGIDPAGGQETAPVSGLSRQDPADAADNAHGGDDAKPATLAPPPSLPGSHALPMPVAPADRNAGDLNPTAALFDAINRGDTAAARDALTRGADVNGHNVLGQTPIDLSVDLGRNDISFLLLSLRSTAEPAPPVAQAAARSSTRLAVPPGKLGLGQPGFGNGAAMQASAKPAPGAGFLGFGGGS